MTMREALDAAMHRQTPDEAMSALRERGMTIADIDTVSSAIHDVYCGIMADHQHPNDKDREQARQLLEAMQRASS